MLKFQKKIYIENNISLKEKILQELHNEGYGGHSRAQSHLQKSILHSIGKKWKNLLKMGPKIEEIY